MPVDTFLQEAEDTYRRSLDDVLELQKVGITPEMIKDLTVRAGACRYAQSTWTD